MDIFTVKSSDSDDTCFIKVEGTALRIELSEPADFQHAWRVANFLIENVKDIVAEAPPQVRG